MKPSNTLWGRVFACCLAVTGTLGFAAGSALAQSDDPGGWFEDPEQPAPPPDDGTARAPDDGPAAPPLDDNGTVPPPDDGPAPPDDSSAAPAPDDNRTAPPASEPDYSPPPADFQPAPAVPPADKDKADESVENDPQAQQRAVEEFSPRLEPYGRWVDDPWYGRIWVPSSSVVGKDFVPYSTGGHWQLTPDDAWLWASDYPFGSITFHYGRWVWASSGGWGWVPGYVYAPAWVDFHVGAVGYVGWSPLAPRYTWRQGAFVSVGLWRPAPVVYCPTNYLFARSMPRYVIRDPVRVHSISAQTHVYRPTRYSSGGYSGGGYASSGRPRYLRRGPSPAEARIPRSALPARRVLAQPHLAPRNGSYRSRTQLESTRLPESRSANIYSRTYNGRTSAQPHRAAAPDLRRYPAARSPAPAARSFDRGERRQRAGSPSASPPSTHPPSVQRGAPSRSYRSYQNGSSAERDGAERSAPPRGYYQRGTAATSPRGAYQREAPAMSSRGAYQREAPAVSPRERSSGYRAMMPHGAERAQMAPRAALPDYSRSARRAPQRRGDDSSSAGSRTRGRQGSWR